MAVIRDQERERRIITLTQELVGLRERRGPRDRQRAEAVTTQLAHLFAVDALVQIASDHHRRSGRAVVSHLRNH